jgi:pyocin large subunit-like protein
MKSNLVRAGVAALLGTAGLLALTACDGGSARPARDHSASAGTSSTSPYSTASRGDQNSADALPREDPRREPVRLVHGKPMWAANRRHSADDNAQYQFNRDGADFGATSLDDFVAKTHAFVDHPPAGALTLVRSNGDKLIYDPKTNVFAVVTKDGAPRTMFKPRDGSAYWDRQKERLADESKGGGSEDGSYHRRYRARNGERSGDDDQG